MSKQDGPKRQMSFTIDEEYWPSFLAYMETHQIERPTHAVKSLIAEALAATPKDGIVIAAGQRAYKSVLAQCLAASGQFYDQLRKDIDQSLADITSTKTQCPHCGGVL